MSILQVNYSNIGNDWLIKVIIFMFQLLQNKCSTVGFNIVTSNCISSHSRSPHYANLSVSLFDLIKYGWNKPTVNYWLIVFPYEFEI